MFDFNLQQPRSLRWVALTITRVNGQAVRSFDDLLICIALETAPGDEIMLGVVRDGKAQDVVVRLEAPLQAFEE